MRVLAGLVGESVGHRHVDLLVLVRLREDVPVARLRDLAGVRDVLSQ
jgi:hypothetical protein